MNNIFQYKEIESPIDDPICTEYKSKYANSKIPIIIDNGSYQCRAGFANDISPKLIFRSLVGKIKSTSNPIVGNSLKESDLSKLTIKSPFDLNLLVHPPSQESIFDYIFHKFGIDSDIENPILITEPTSNPSFCRKYMSELLFECYNIKSVAYGIDSLFSFYGQKDNFKDGGKNALIIGSSYNTTHIYNVQNYNVSHEQTKRINIGGSNSTDYLKKLIHLKYPKHKSYFSTNYTNKVKEEHCYVSKGQYIEELKEFENDKLAKEKSVIIQLPYQEVDYEKLEEERQRKIQNRKDLGAKLREMADKKRLEKKLELEERLSSLESLLSLKSTNLEEFNNSLKLKSYQNEKELLKDIEEVKEKLFGKKKESESSTTDDKEFPLLCIADSELTAEQLKEKKNQKTLKSMKDGRLAKKRKRVEEKEKEKEKEEERDRLEEEMFIKDPEQYIKDLHFKKNIILDRKEQKLKAKQRVNIVQRNSRLRTIVNPTIHHIDKSEEDVDPEDIEDSKELLILDKLLTKFDPNSIGSAIAIHDDNASGAIEYHTAEDFQVSLGVERIKCPETLFQPKAIIGMDQMGLIEAIISTVLSQIQPKDTRSLVTENIFLTGGNVNTKQFKDRIHYEIQQIREPRSPLNILKSIDSQLDAWLGARKWVNDIDPSQWSKFSISKQEYQEYGYDYIKSHFASNLSLN